jgi:hypothetical protein
MEAIHWTCQRLVIEDIKRENDTVVFSLRLG